MPNQSVSPRRILLKRANRPFESGDGSDDTEYSAAGVAAWAANQVGLTFGTGHGDVYEATVSALPCNHYGTVFNALALCCPDFLGGPAIAPGVSGPPTLMEQLEPLLEMHQVTVFERDFRIVFDTLPTEEPAHIIPISDLGAVRTYAGSDGANPEMDRSTTTEEVFLDGQDSFNVVDVRTPTLEREGMTTLVRSQDEDGADGVHAVFDIPYAVTPETATRTTNDLRTRSKVEHPITIWTTPKWLGVALNDLVRVEHKNGTTDFRVTEIEWGTDGVLKIGGLVWQSNLIDGGEVPLDQLPGAGQDLG